MIKYIFETEKERASTECAISSPTTTKDRTKKKKKIIRDGFCKTNDWSL